MERTPDTILDELLVLDSQAGDEAALAELVRRWHPRLLAHAFRLTGDQDGAGDVVQEAWLGIVRGLERIDDPARFAGWARRVVANKAADWIRRRQVERRTSPLDLSTASAAETPGRSSEASRAVRDAIAGLDDAHRSVVALHYVEDMSVAEIAAVLDIPVGTVKSRLHTARERLRTALERSES
jgi:RNA polymerase sigma-70 factor (ECF subfamily)